MRLTKQAGRWPLTCVVSCLALAVSGAVSAQEVGAKDVPDGPAPAVAATEVAAEGPAAFRFSNDAAAAVPNHPPIHLIPPRPMPAFDEVKQTAAAATNANPGNGVLFDVRTRKTAVFDANFAGAKEGWFAGGGASGADGGGGQGDLEAPASMSGSMSVISAASRALHPWRMNVKLVLRFGASYFVCSGTMRDARTVLTAGHCVNEGGGGAWADEIWVYPGWDGQDSIIPPSSITNPYGWAHSTTLGSWTNWTVGGDITYDVGIIALDRAVGALTGWFGWAWSSACPWTNTINNVSYPAEGCGTPGLHNGRDMYNWFGTFDSCSDRRLGLVTVPGCFTAIWGGMSGSGAYIIDGDARYVHGICSTSNRSTAATYQRQFQDWVDWNNNTFIPTYARGPNFDLEPLDMNSAVTVVPAGSATGALTHLATNATNGTANKNFVFNVYLSTNDNIETTDTLLSVQNYNWNFGALGSVTVNMVPVTIPSNTPPGNYYLGVIYDNATDGNTANNDSDGWDAVAITVTKPDLDVTAFSVPASAQPGDVIAASNTVQNIGSAAAGSFRVGIYFSSDATCNTSDTLIGSRTIASLAAGASSAANTPATIPSGAAVGTRYICAVADDLGAVAESNESNNSASTSLTIVQPDLTFPALGAPAKASPGGGITISNTVRNDGTAAAGAFRVGLYLSDDANCTRGDMLLGSRALAGLAAGASSAANTGVTIPAGTALGSYFVCGIADDLAQVAESSEANNTNSAALAVVSATPVITLKVNGQHPTPPVVTVSGPTVVTVDVSDSTYTASVDWYWAIILNGQIYWVTAAGLSTSPAPWFNYPPVELSNLQLLNLTLPPGTTMTNALFMLNGATSVSFDFITATRP